MGIIDGGMLPLVVEGYPGRQSCVAGDVVEFHCSSLAASFSVEVTRVGAERVVVWDAAGVHGHEHPVPPDAATNGCAWPVTFAIPVGPTWRSGFYEVAFRADGIDGPEGLSHSFFVVRGNVERSPDGMLLVLSTNTWNAYNTFGGTCLYLGATQVSFERPMVRGFLNRPEAAYDGRLASIVPEGDPEHHQLQTYLKDGQWPMWSASAGWYNWERRFVRWAETNGYHMDVAVNADLEQVPDLLDGYRLLLSVGHDEYWSWAMRDAIDTFVERGGNHAIFSGNTSCWQVRLEGDNMVCFKGAAAEADPVVGTDRSHLMTAAWFDPRIGRPDAATTGLSFSRGGYARVGKATPRGSGGFTVYRPEHWVFEGTELCYGDVVGASATIVGYEVDGCAFTLRHGLPEPTYDDATPDGLHILATAPARLLANNDTLREVPKALWADPDGPGDLETVASTLFGDTSAENIARIAHNSAVMAVFDKGSGTVFNAGTTDWAYGLDSDPVVQRITTNVLNRLSQP